MNSQPLRVLIVDDSRIFRSVIEEVLARQEDVRVVGSVWSGEKALEFARLTPPDLVTLDISMPGLGGLETLKALRRISTSTKHPIGVLLISSYTKSGASITMEGLQEGAFDFITKPASPDVAANAATLGTQLLEKIQAYRSSCNRRSLAKLSSGRVAASPRATTRFQALVLGASTGGPEALAHLLPAVAPECPVPMFLVQHLPPGFTDYFATSLARRCGSRVVAAEEGMFAEPRVLYVAPGGKHLVLHSRGSRIAIGLSEAPPENGCRPSADVLFRSAAAAYAGRVIAVVLSGMGSDGSNGAVVLRRAGGYILVQDEATSVVWGMPGSTIAAGAADEVLPIAEMGASLRRHLGLGE